MRARLDARTDFATLIRPFCFTHGESKKTPITTSRKIGTLNAMSITSLFYERHKFVLSRAF
jgi:hypothetical protein